MPVSVSQVGEAPNVVQEKKVPDTEQIVSRVENPWSHNQKLHQLQFQFQLQLQLLQQHQLNLHLLIRTLKWLQVKATPVPQSIVEQNTRVSEATKAPESNGKHDLEDKNDEEKF